MWTRPAHSWVPDLSDPVVAGLKLREFPLPERIERHGAVHDAMSKVLAQVEQEEAMGLRPKPLLGLVQ